MCVSLFTLFNLYLYIKLNVLYPIKENRLSHFLYVISYVISNFLHTDADPVGIESYEESYYR